MGSGKTLHHLTVKITANIRCVINGDDLARTVAKLFDRVTLGRVSCTFVLYSVIFCSPWEVASDVISGVAVEDVNLYVGVKLPN